MSIHPWALTSPVSCWAFPTRLRRVMPAQRPRPHFGHPHGPRLSGQRIQTGGVQPRDFGAAASRGLAARQGFEVTTAALLSRRGKLGLLGRPFWVERNRERGRQHDSSQRVDGIEDSGSVSVAAGQRPRPSLGTRRPVFAGMIGVQRTFISICGVYKLVPYKPNRCL